MKVLIAMSDTGSGHRSLSNAVAEALHLRFNARVAIVDLFALDEGSFAYKFSRLYGPIIRWRPELYGAVFHLSDNNTFYRFISGPGARALAPKARRLIQHYRPDLIVSAHSLCNRLLLEALDGLGEVPTIATITELARVHSSWIEPGLSQYTAASQEVVRGAVQHGAPVHRIALTGLPVGRRFGNVTVPRADLRRAYGLDPEKFTVVAVGGGEGAGGLGKLMPHVWKQGLDLQSVVVTGRAEKLKAQLEAVAPSGNRTLGFSRIMPELMHLADVVVTKGGPQTIVEALCARKPLLVTQTIPGQESGNDVLVERHGAGFATRTPERLACRLDLLMRDQARREQMAAAATELAKPGAADEVAKVCGQLLGIAPDERRSQPAAVGAW